MANVGMAGWHMIQKDEESAAHLKLSKQRQNSGVNHVPCCCHPNICHVPYCHPPHMIQNMFLFWRGLDHRIIDHPPGENVKKPPEVFFSFNPERLERILRKACVDHVAENQPS